ncbi:PREDICTED: uncharacterized protein LOC106114439 [Papilio xuthus]|uniref:Uncharacterized protein LOC106114439 n=1 Tax=Papilio xuthus TaxID=66420 RepID=A0AAJ6Z199_PAPXU|nr:PREDICTED: uncharacterized protein LOC106114439 [Papilio xuthus]
MSYEKSNANENEENSIDAFTEDNDNIMISSTIQDDVLKMLLKDQFEGKTKLGPDVLPLVKQLANCLIMECCHRAGRLAIKDGCTEIKVEHIEKCMEQIMCDFP